MSNVSKIRFYKINSNPGRKSPKEIARSRLVKTRWLFFVSRESNNMDSWIFSPLRQPARPLRTALNRGGSFFGKNVKKSIDIYESIC